MGGVSTPSGDMEPGALTAYGAGLRPVGVGTAPALHTVMPTRHDRLETIELAALEYVTGGKNSSASGMMLAMAMMGMRKRRGAPKIAPEAPPVQAAEAPVKFELNGKEEKLARGEDGSLSFDNTKEPAAKTPTQTA